MLPIGPLPTPTSSEVLGQKFVLSTPQPIKRLGWSLKTEANVADEPSRVDLSGAVYELGGSPSAAVAFSSRGAALLQAAARGGASTRSEAVCCSRAHGGGT